MEEDEYEGKGGIEKSIEKRWEGYEEGIKENFRLSEGVKWKDGKKFN